MLIGTAFAYMIIKTREDFMNDFDKWCQIVQWEEIKASGVPKWATEKEDAVIMSEESDTGEEN